MNKKHFLVIVLIISIAISCTNNKWTENRTELIFGKSIILNKALAKYHSKSFIGDGFNIDVFRLSDKYVEYIVNNFEEIRLKYPQIPDYMKNWDNVSWKETPVDGDIELIYNFIIGNEDFYWYNSGSFQKAVRYFESLINTTGNYYSYSYRLIEWPDGRISIGNLTFNLFSQKEKILICIDYKL